MQRCLVGRRVVLRRAWLGCARCFGFCKGWSQRFGWRWRGFWLVRLGQCGLECFVESSRAGETLARLFGERPLKQPVQHGAVTWQRAI
jgi:hypothetical protein